MSRDRPSTVQRDDLASDIAAGGCQEVDEIGDIFRSASSGKGNALEIFLALLLRVIGRPLDTPGSDAVDGDIGREGAGQAAGQGGEGGFAGGIDEILGP